MYTVKRTVEDGEPHYYILFEANWGVRTIAECWDTDDAKKIADLLNKAVEV